ncbi:hypothetical protein MVEG_10278 [Podila verticillata NRRL 6337]|nr:hypothetical protein MVEG_10278 [Podila verticillata NRRL 6337]
MIYEADDTLLDSAPNNNTTIIGTPASNNPFFIADQNELGHEPMGLTPRFLSTVVHRLDKAVPQAILDSPEPFTVQDMLASRISTSQEDESEANNTLADDTPVDTSHSISLGTHYGGLSSALGASPFVLGRLEAYRNDPVLSYFFQKTGAPVPRPKTTEPEDEEDLDDISEDSDYYGSPVLHIGNNPIKKKLRTLHRNHRFYLADVLDALSSDESSPETSPSSSCGSPPLPPRTDLTPPNPTPDRKRKAKPTPPDDRSGAMFAECAYAVLLSNRHTTAEQEQHASFLELEADRTMSPSVEYNWQYCEALAAKAEQYLKRTENII